MPFNPPVFPLTPNYGNSYKTIADTNKSQYNEAGIIQRGLKGINPLTKTFNFSVVTDKLDDLEDFLNNYLGKPCKLSFDGGVTVQPEVWRVNSYTQQYFTDGLITFSCEFEQIRRYR
jgi:phage-related protein